MVTIVVPAYNSSVTLRETLLSVQNQSYQDWECIIVDDCSSDNSVEIAQMFVRNDNRFLCLQHERNRGVSAARNTALSIAKGRYIQFLDADDAIAPAKLSSHVNYLDANKDIDLVYSDFFHFSDRVDFTKRGEYREDEKLNGTSSIVLKRLLHGNVFRMNTLLIRRRVFDIGAFNPNFRAVEDWEFWMRCAAIGFSFAFLNNESAVSAVRINPNGLSKDVSGMRRYHLQVLQDVWSLEGLSLQTRILLWTRYLLVFFDHLFFSRGEIRFTEKRKITFIIHLSILVIFTWPFFFLYKLIRLF